MCNRTKISDLCHTENNNLIKYQKIYKFSEKSKKYCEIVLTNLHCGVILNT